MKTCGLVLCLISIINTQSSEYTFIKDVNIGSSVQQSALIASYNTQNSVLCLGACNRNPNCLSCSFNTATTTSGDCYLYNRVFTSNDFSLSNNVNWYSKKVNSKSLMLYFQSATLNSSITRYNGTTFTGLVSTEMMLVNNTPVYFLADWFKNVLIKMSDSWQYITANAFNNPNAIKWANDYLYVATHNGFHKMDYNFNIIKSIVDNGSAYSGIYHNASDNTLAITLWWRYRVDWIDAANLTVLATVSLRGYKPIGIARYGVSLYVSAYNGNSSTVIYVITNKVINNTISISDTTVIYIYSIVFDDYGYMALSFKNQKIIQLYHINGTSTGFNLTFPYNVYNLNFDFNRRMMISTLNALYLFN